LARRRITRDQAYFAGSAQRVTVGDGHMDAGFDDGEWAFTKGVTLDLPRWSNDPVQQPGELNR
jgi:hypothetical protein